MVILDKGKFKISGYLIQAYFICKRQVWLLSRHISQFQDNFFLEMGKLSDQKAYSREGKEIEFDNLKFDLIRSDKGNTVIGEVKKSSRGIGAAKKQLLYYLYRLKKKGVLAKGEILVPKEKKKEEVLLTDDAEEEIENDLEEIKKIVKSEKPPLLVKNKYCKKCAYNEFCWAEVK